MRQELDTVRTALTKLEMHEKCAKVVVDRVEPAAAAPLGVASSPSTRRTRIRCKSAEAASLRGEVS